jgi:hypothetical protein
MADGRVVFDAVITRPGVFVYREDGKERRELRLPEDVFSPASLATYMLAPVTNGHPTRLLDSKTMKDRAVGAIGEVRRDGDVVRGPLAVFDAKTLADMERGRQALSAGYSIDIDETPGEHPLYGRYDARQFNITVNHVAIVDSGRAGPEARVRMDSMTARRSPAHIHPAIHVANMLGALRAPRRSE